MSLTAAQRAWIRRRTRAHDLDPSEQRGELNVIPLLDVVVNMIVFLLVLSASALAVAQVATRQPTHGPAGRPPDLGLTVAVTEAGVVVAGTGGRLAPGCQETTSGEGVTVPTIGGGHDWAALSACAARVGARFPQEREVVITADPAVPFEDVVHAMDAVRSHGGRTLFADVRIAAGLR